MNTEIKSLSMPFTPKMFLEWLEASTGQTYDASYSEAVKYISAVVNLAYLDGLDGESGYPEDPERDLSEWIETFGVEPTEGRRAAVKRLTAWRNAAYREGRRVREEDCKR